MPEEVPEPAVKAALAAYAHALYDRPDPTVLSDKALMRIVLEAAAPILAQEVAGRILAHMNAHGPHGPGFPGSTGGMLRRAWRRHFGIAAQVAALAFSTGEDIRREATAALNRGDYSACYLDDNGNPVAGERKD